MEPHHLQVTPLNMEDFVAKCCATKLPELSDVTKCGSSIPDELALSINASIMRINSGEFKSEELGRFLASLHEMWDRIHFYNISKLDFIPIVVNVHSKFGIYTPIMQEVLSYLDRMGILDRIMESIKDN